MPPAADILATGQGSGLLNPEPGAQTSAPASLASAHASEAPAVTKYRREGSAVSTLEVSFSFDSNFSSDSLPPVKRSATRRPATWQIEASDFCLRTVNPIRRITDAASLPTTDPTAPKKELISLGQGDPTVFGHVAVEEAAAEAVAEALRSGKFNGYTPSFGLPQTREAVARYLNESGGPHVKFSPSDVYITSGCGHSFQLCLEALSNPGKNVLLPRPGFPVYDCWCADAGLEIRRYSLLPEQNWEVDLEQVRQLADKNTVAILICHPGNPCGNVFSKKHLKEILTLAEELKLPIISDEIYGGIHFGQARFTPAAAVAEEALGQASQDDDVTGTGDDVSTRDGSSALPSRAGEDKRESQGLSGGAWSAVPILTVSSISKTLLVPGWRLGWIAVHDPSGILAASKVRQALENRLQYTTLTCSLIQAALPKILGCVKPDFFRGLNASLEAALAISLAEIKGIPGLGCPSEPQGGMFLMVHLDLKAFKGFASDIEWCRALLAEESVVVIPGTAFEFPGWFRSLLSAPAPVLEAAWSRIGSFCRRHSAAA